jgi:endogenous inhibitor of DNA gyrase (YacG/DUF329 family)
MSAADPSGDPPPAAKSCPICGKPVVSRYAPFCSRRCADRDLHRWLGGHYAIAAEPASDDDAPPTGEAEDS